ncbi:MAG: hypothetical protein KIT58_07035 [Planctomycetota bacterium]|nr:hypothetical protein [Planctomycetota bacterium]
MEPRDAFLAALARGLSVAAAARGAGVTRDAAYKWARRGDEEVARALEARRRAPASSQVAAATAESREPPAPPSAPGVGLDPQPHGGALRRTPAPATQLTAQELDELEAQIRGARTARRLERLGKRVLALVVRGQITPRVGDVVTALLREQRQAIKMRREETQRAAVAALEVLTAEEAAALEEFRAARRPRPVAPGETVPPPPVSAEQP